MPVTIDDIEAARARIADGVVLTPCARSIPLSELCHNTIYCKLDALQRTGSFKERGARNALLLLDDVSRKCGVIAASAGNHALGLAYHGGLLGIPVTVVMPRFAPLIKVSTCRQLGARVIQQGDTFSEVRAVADKEAAQQGLTYIHGFDDPAIIAGQGTMGLEVLEQVPDVDAIVVPVGGAGLIAGVALAVKMKRPEVRIIGVEAENTGCFAAAMKAGKPVPVAMRATLADGLAVGQVGDASFTIAKQHVDQVVQVNEQALALAIVRLIEREKIVIEGAAAAPLAAFLSGQLDDLRDKNVVLALCGGNIDLTILDRVISLGLVADGRLCRFTAVISDRPGGLAQLAQVIAATGASVKEIVHDRAFSGPDVAAVRTVCIVETHDQAHVAQVMDALKAAGIELIRTHI
ncbi:MAG: threonine ammonia-lyase [Gammaproteobacteria bacterium]|nr:MAG: threonine ammonia-lyase [Gammaproteobacteria bacterium]